MLNLDVSRSATSLQILVELGCGRGLSVARCLAGTGLDAGVVDDPRAEVSGREELAVVRTLLRELGDAPGLGREAGARYHVTAYGVLGYAVLSSPTLRAALELGVEYLDLCFPLTRMTLERRAPETRLRIDACDLPPDVRRFAVERDAAAVVTGLREMLGAEVTGWRLVLAGSAGVLHLPDATLDRPLPLANERTRLECEAACRALVAARGSRSGVAGRVRRLLRAGAGTMPDMEDVAARMAMTSRTLRRHLEGEGTSFRDLVDEVREALADELLADGEVPIWAVAERLGYSEPAAFSRAYRRWKGVSPRAGRPARRPAGRRREAAARSRLLTPVAGGGA